MTYETRDISQETLDIGGLRKTSDTIAQDVIRETVACRWNVVGNVVRAHETGPICTGSGRLL